MIYTKHIKKTILKLLRNPNTTKAEVCKMFGYSYGYFLKLLKEWKREKKK